MRPTFGVNESPATPRGRFPVNLTVSVHGRAMSKFFANSIRYSYLALSYSPPAISSTRRSEPYKSSSGNPPGEVAYAA